MRMLMRTTHLSPCRRELLSHSILKKRALGKWRCKNLLPAFQMTVRACGRPARRVSAGPGPRRPATGPPVPDSWRTAPAPRIRQRDPALVPPHRRPTRRSRPAPGPGRQAPARVGGVGRAAIAFSSPSPPSLDPISSVRRAAGEGNERFCKLCFTALNFLFFYFYDGLFPVHFPISCVFYPRFSEFWRVSSKLSSINV